MLTDDQGMPLGLDADIESGMIIQIEEPDTLAPHPETISAWHIMVGLSALVFAEENCPRIIAAMLLSCVSTGLNFLSPTLLGETISVMESEDNTTTFAGVSLSWEQLIGILVASYFLAQVVANVRDQVMAPVTGNNVKKLMSNSAEHLLKKSLDYHVNTDAALQFALIQRGFSMSTIGAPLLTQILPMVLQIGIAGSLLSYQYSVDLGASVVLLSAVYAAYSAATAKYVIRSNQDMLNSWNEVYASSQGAIKRYKIMRDFGKFEETMAALDAVLTHCWSSSFVNTLTKPLQIGLGHSVISYAHMFWAARYVGAGVRSGQFNVQDFVAIFGYLLQLSNLMPAFGLAINALFASYPDLKFVLGELAKPDEVVDMHPDMPLLLVDGEPPSIEFDRVTFHYPPKCGEPMSPPLFDNLSFKVAANQRVVLVGKSGAGKSALLNLLYGYYQPTSGTIKINDQDISGISLNALQRNITLFRQKSNLFKGTIRQNICYGAELPATVTDDAIWALARDLNLFDFLNELDQKLDTDVGEGGESISGGEQQKIAILRGLIGKNSPIWLLDEVTSSLDSQAALQVLQTIDSASEGVTRLMITHKLTGMQDADQIIVLDKGKIVAQGKHDALMHTSELYTQLWRGCNESSATASSGGLFSQNRVALVADRVIEEKSAFTY